MKKHGSELKFFVWIFRKLHQINLWNQGKWQPSKIVRFFLTFICHICGTIKPYCRATITFLFPLKLLLKQKILHNIKTAHFWGGIACPVLLSDYFLKYTPLLKDLRKRFFGLELEHCTLIENPLRRLILLRLYCNFNPPARLNNVWYLWNV